MKTLKYNEIQQVSGGEGAIGVANLYVEGVKAEQYPLVLNALHSLEGQNANSDQFLSALKVAGIDISKTSVGVYYNAKISV